MALLPHLGSDTAALEIFWHPDIADHAGLVMPEHAAAGTQDIEPMVLVKVFAHTPRTGLGELELVRT
jgi:hypothetical protein